MQEVSDAAKLAIDTGVDESAYDGLFALVLPQPDPDEELLTKLKTAFDSDDVVAMRYALRAAHSRIEAGWEPKL